MSFSSYKKEVVLLLAGCVLLFIPLLRDFHFELAFTQSILAAFYSFNSANKEQSYVLQSVRTLYYAALFSLPSFVFALIKVCLSFEGLALWMLMVIPSSFLGIAIFKVLSENNIKSIKLIGNSLFVLIATIIPIVELLNYPQVYLFNHIWAYWPGPIYDDAIQVTGSLIVFRFITILWVILLWNVSSFSGNLQSKVITILAFVSLLMSYTQLDDWNIISPNQTLELRLSNRVETEHFILSFDPDHFTDDEVRYYSSKHEFYFSQIINLLDVDWPKNRKITSYLYADAWQKKELVGAKFTSYVPIWLERDQMHIAKQQLDDVLKHELVHVIAKQFGNSLFNGSWNIGMIEGLATAIDKDASSVSTLNQIVSAESPLPTKEELMNAFSWKGFYGSSAGVSYTTTGSFVDYLIKTLPVEDLKEAYRTGNFDHYPISFDLMYEEWSARVSGTFVDSLDQQVSERIFGQRSLFERDCPHVLTEENKLLDTIIYAETKDDSTKIYESFSTLYALNSENEFVKTEWLRWSLLTGHIDDVIETIQPSDTLLTHQLLKADAYMLNGNYEAANQTLSNISQDLKATNARQFRYSIDLRMDSLNWQVHVDRRFRKILPSMDQFKDLSLANKLLSLNKSLEFDDDAALLDYISSISKTEYNADWFDIYMNALDRLAYLNEPLLFDVLLEPVLFIDLRSRYKERMADVIAYQNFQQQYLLK